MVNLVINNILFSILLMEKYICQNCKTCQFQYHLIPCHHYLCLNCCHDDNSCIICHRRIIVKVSILISDNTEIRNIDKDKLLDLVDNTFNNEIGDIDKQKLSELIENNNETINDIQRF